MFKDYYKILEIHENATEDEIKVAFKKQAFKWHPDKNSGIDTTAKMQDINEAYLILKDREARDLYNVTYRKYKQSFASQESNPKEESQKQKDFVVEDETLKKWMENAHKQAVNLAKQMMEEFTDLSKKGFSAAGSEIWQHLKIYFIIFIALSIIMSLAKGCG